MLRTSTEYGVHGVQNAAAAGRGGYQFCAPLMHVPETPSPTGKAPSVRFSGGLLHEPDETICITDGLSPEKKVEKKNSDRKIDVRRKAARRMGEGEKKKEYDPSKGRCLLLSVPLFPPLSSLSFASVAISSSPVPGTCGRYRSCNPVILRPPYAVPINQSGPVAGRRDGRDVLERGS